MSELQEDFYADVVRSIVAASAPRGELDYGDEFPYSWM